MNTFPRLERASVSLAFSKPSIGRCMTPTLGAGILPEKSSQPTMTNRLIEPVRNAKGCIGEFTFTPPVRDLADNGCIASVEKGPGPRIELRGKWLSWVGNHIGRIIFLSTAF